MCVCSSIPIWFTKCLKNFSTTPSIREQNSSATKDYSAEVKMTQKLLHLSFAFTALTTAQRRKLVSARKWIKVCHLPFFYKFALFLFCIFIWKKLKLHQKIAQKCCYCKTIKVTFVLRSHFSVHGFLHTEFQMTTLFRGTTCPPDVVGQMKPDTTLTLFAHLFLANKRMYLVVN